MATVAPFGGVSSTTLSKWLVECIKLAGPEAIFSDKVRAPDMIALSASWALFNGASVMDIVKAAYWSNANTFIACYLKDVVRRACFVEQPWLHLASWCFIQCHVIILDFYLRFFVLIILIFLPPLIIYQCYSASCDLIRKVRQLLWRGILD